MHPIETQDALEDVFGPDFSRARRSQEAEKRMHKIQAEAELKRVEHRK